MLNETDQRRRDRMGINQQEQRRMKEESKEAARQRDHSSKYDRMHFALRQITHTTTVSECQRIARAALGE